jgi:hypothetical protein
MTGQSSIKDFFCSLKNFQKKSIFRDFTGSLEFSSSEAKTGQHPVFAF